MLGSLCVVDAVSFSVSTFPRKRQRAARTKRRTAYQYKWTFFSIRSNLGFDVTDVAIRPVKFNVTCRAVHRPEKRDREIPFRSRRISIQTHQTQQADSKQSEEWSSDGATDTCPAATRLRHTQKKRMGLENKKRIRLAHSITIIDLKELKRNKKGGERDEDTLNNGDT